MLRSDPAARTTNPVSTALAAGAIVVAGLAAYHGSFSGPFVFLDVPAIVENPTIRHLWPIGPALSPPSAGGLTVGGRPVVNLSFAVNYALGGTNVWGYHAVNLAIHILAGLTLFGIIRRTPMSVGRVVLDEPRLVEDDSPYLIAFATALLWTVHPLQTESVTYIVQRAESLMGLFYLLTLYCFIRSADEAGNGRSATGDRPGPGGIPIADRPSPITLLWSSLSVLACLAGMATKEVMVSAPVMVLLYDRTFVSGTFREAWRRHSRLYLGLAATWILLASMVLGTGGNRGGTSGFGIGVSWWSYALTQFPAIVSYLRLAVWPHPLVFDYGAHWVGSGWAVLPDALVVMAVAAATIWGFLTSRPLAFAGVFFFAILAPTSLVPGMSQTMAEHRMYLALAPVLALAVLAIFRLCRRPPLAAVVCLVLAVALAGATARRNEDYRSGLALWGDTAAKNPDDPYPRNNLGIALAGAGRRQDAIDQFREALRLKPDYAEADNNLGLALAGDSRLPEAISHYEEALRLKPDYPEAQANLGVALADLGRFPEAISHFEEAVRLEPDYAAAHNNLAVALASTGRLPEAIAEYGRFLQLKPDSPETRYNLGNALAQTGRVSESIIQYGEALRLKPDYPEAEANLGAALAAAGRLPEAVAHYREALRLDPGDADVHYNLGLALRALGRAGDAEEQFKQAGRR